MNGQKVNDLAEVAGIFEVSEHGSWILEVDMINTERDESWGGLDQFEEPGTYVLMRVDK